MKNGDFTFRLAAGTLVALLCSVASGGVWAGKLQDRVEQLEQESARSRALILTKLDSIETQLVELKLQLRQETTEQRMYHKGK